MTKTSQLRQTADILSAFAHLVDIRLWEGFGFVPLSGAELRRLAWQLPNFAREATEGTKYMALELKK